MTSVVIAAHNEAATIGRCLESLLADAAPGEFDVTVVANGCSDATARQAGAYAGVRVLEIDQASKPAALNAGDSVAVGFPRVYLDADIAVSTSLIRALREALSGPRTLAAYPDRRLDLVGRSLPVRAYFAINSRLPVFRTGLFGRGVIAVSKGGRARFESFPEMVADDLFLDSLFSSEEKQLVADVFTVVGTPYRTKDLVRRLVRVRRGNAAMRTAARTGDVVRSVRPARRLSWLFDVVIPRPWLAPAAVVYVAISAWASLVARSGDPGDMSWGRDESSRTRANSRARRMTKR
jgi:glycosyltransferase involved in cell wall biosynthesis